MSFKIQSCNFELSKLFEVFSNKFLGRNLIEFLGLLKVRPKIIANLFQEFVKITEINFK